MVERKGTGWLSGNEGARVIDEIREEPMSAGAGDVGAHPTGDVDGESRRYEAPTVVVLGTVAELTQLGTGAADELLSDGSTA